MKISRKKHGLVEFKPEFIERLTNSLGVVKSSLSSWLKDRTSAIEKGWFWPVAINSGHKS